MGAFFSSSSSEEDNESVTLQYINLFNAVMQHGERLPDNHVAVTHIFSEQKMIFDYTDKFGEFGYEITLRPNQTVGQMETELKDFWTWVSGSFDRTWKLARNTRNEDLAKGGIKIEFKISKSSEFTQKILTALTGEIISMIPQKFWFCLVFSPPERTPKNTGEFEEFKKAVWGRFVQTANFNYEYNALKVTDAQKKDFNKTYRLEWIVFIESVFVDMYSLRRNINRSQQGLYNLFMNASGPITDPSFPNDKTKYGKIEFTPNPINQ